jgi:hypothetical protein
MKKNLLFLTLLFSLSKCIAQSDSLPISVIIKVDSEYIKTYSIKEKFIKDLIGSNNWIVKSDSVKEKFYEISITIKNISDTTIAIFLMSCSWTDNFIVNNKYMHLRGEQCDNNFPSLVQFKPGESKSYKGILTKSMKLTYKCGDCTGFPIVETTKLGLIIVDDIFRRTPSNNYFLAMEDKSVWKIVWSNSLYLLTKDEAYTKSLDFGVYHRDQ